MNKIFSGASAVGVIVVLLGILLLARNVFNLDIPVFTILISVALIIGGIFLITGSFTMKRDGQHVQFGESHFQFNPGQRNYSVQFGEGTLNLKGHKPDSNIPISVECSFGQFRIVADREVPLRVTGQASFAELRGPDARKVSFGDYTFMSPDYNPAQPGFTIDARVSFGELAVIYL